MRIQLYVYFENNPIYECTDKTEVRRIRSNSRIFITKNP